MHVCTGPIALDCQDTDFVANENWLKIIKLIFRQLLRLRLSASTALREFSSLGASPQMGWTLRHSTTWRGTSDRILSRCHPYLSLDISKVLHLHPPVSRARSQMLSSFKLKQLKDLSSILLAFSTVWWGEKVLSKGVLTVDCEKTLQDAVFCQGPGCVPANTFPLLPLSLGFLRSVTAPGYTRCWSLLSAGFSSRSPKDEEWVERLSHRILDCLQLARLRLA